MDPQQAIAIVNSIMLSQQGRPLSNLEQHVLKESLAGKSYEAMAEGWAPKTVKDAGARLWKYISQALGETISVNKSNVSAALIQLYQIKVESLGLSLDHNFQDPRDAPFSDRGRITNPQRFFDRKDSFRQIFDGFAQGCSQSIVGESTIGKSSLLEMICCQGEKYLPSHQFILLDMQCIHDEQDFFMALCEKLEIDPSCRGFELSRQLRGQNVILCLDEIERMTDQLNFSERLRSELRGLAEGRYSPLTLAIASRSPLIELFPDKPEMTSPLAGICHSHRLGPFSDSIARAFLKSRLSDTEVEFSEPQIKSLIAQSQGNPGQLQLLASGLYRDLSSC